MGASRLVSTIFFAIILSHFLVSARKYHVPVLIWGSNYDTSKGNRFPSLARVGSDEFCNHFSKTVHKADEKPTIIMFVEETLSVEDFSVHDVKHEGSFPLLKTLVSKYNLEFLPSVENPITALTAGPENKSGFTISELNTNSGTANDLGKHNAIYMVNLEDADSKEDRPQMLHRHDKKISVIFDELTKVNKNVVGILTGRYSSWTEPEEIIRVRREINESDTSSTPATPKASPGKISSGDAAVFQTKSALIYSKSFPVLEIDGKEKVVLQKPTNQHSDDREKWQRAGFVFSTSIGKVTLRFRFENSSNYWSLSQVELEEPSGGDIKLLTTQPKLSAPYGQSFHTALPVVFKNGTNSLTFSDMQVQPWKSQSEGEKKFGLADSDTSVYFTPEIWTGLIVTGLIGIILMWGLSMILDIHTMDQFDDPKGKTITVNVSD